MKKLFIGGIIALSFIGCTNWQAEYQKKFAEAALPIQGKFEFMEKMYHNMQEDKDTIIYYDNVDKVPVRERQRLIELLPNGTFKEEKDILDFWIMNPSGYDDNNRVFEDSKDSWSNSYSYYYFANDTVYSEDMMEDALYHFDQYIVKPLQAAKYLLLIKDKLIVRPRVNMRDFDGGYILSHVIVFDIEAKEQIDSFDVAAENSGNVRLSMDSAYMIDLKTGQYELMKDLCSNLNNNAISKARKRISE